MGNRASSAIPLEPQQPFCHRVGFVCSPSNEVILDHGKDPVHVVRVLR